MNGVQESGRKTVGLNQHRETKLKGGVKGRGGPWPRWAVVVA